MGRVDEEQKHGDLPVGLSGKGGRGGLPAGLLFFGVHYPVGASLLAMAICATPQISACTTLLCGSEPGGAPFDRDG
ncbi:hypothetical protein EMIT0P176_10400 [Pseudomonas sp. IT-P176]